MTESEASESSSSNDPSAPGGSDPFLALESELSVMLRRARHYSKSLAQSLHEELEPDSYVLLVWISRDDQVRLTDLAAYLGVGKPTVSRQLQTLERIGLISRTPDPHDSRSLRLCLTDLGKERVQRAAERRIEFVRKQFSSWPAEDVSEFTRLLVKLNTAADPATRAPYER